MEGNTESFVDKFSRGVSWLACEARRGRGMVSMRGQSWSILVSMRGQSWSILPDRFESRKMGSFGYIRSIDKCSCSCRLLFANSPCLPSYQRSKKHTQSSSAKNVLFTTKWMPFSVTFRVVCARCCKLPNGPRTILRREIPLATFFYITGLKKKINRKKRKHMQIQPDTSTSCDVSPHIPN